MTPRKAKVRMRSILVVEDDEVTLRMVDKMLSGAGYTVIQASNGIDALSLARDKRPDLLILDIVLPGLDGILVASRLKDDPKTRDIPIIFFSSLEEKDIEKRKDASSDWHFLRKPCNREELLQEIAHYL
jgi:CheY-like chemotaxis protein